MNMLFFIGGTLAALAYFALGLMASAHLIDTEKRSERFLSTGMLWSLASGRYDGAGKTICMRGNVALVVAAGCWVAWGVLNYKV